MLDRLTQRFPRAFLAERMRLQVNLVVTRVFGHRVGDVHLENLPSLFPALRVGLKASGLWARGQRNSLALRTTRQVFELPGLPAAFDGLKILHLSDLHVDVEERYPVDLIPRVGAIAAALEFDLCVITGDFRWATHGDYHPVVQRMGDLLPSLSCTHGVFGVLGNHDFIEQALYFEELGIQMLVNEASPLERDGERLWLVGLDDPHLYGTYSFAAALADVPAADCKIMMVHSPELADEAAGKGVALYLTGHTHGGQLCLPGGIAPYVNASCPRSRTIGPWRCATMQGYTSAGVGCSGLPVRFNRPPEIALHELRRAR